MTRRILIVQGHPDPRGGHLCHALADAYAAGAEEARHAVRRIEVSGLDFPLLRTKTDWDTGTPCAAIRACQEDLAWADQLLIVYPLWMGGMPALLKGFLEQVLRPGFALRIGNGGAWTKLLAGKAARIVVTMGMPALVYRWYFRAHSLRSLKRSILGLCGIAPIRDTLIGGVEAIGMAQRQAWLDQLRRLGRVAR